MVLIGEDWVAPATGDTEIRARRRKRGFVSLKRSPLARKIIVFNLLGLIVLVAGVLYLNPGRDSLVQQREHAFATQASLIADVFEVQLPANGPVSLIAGDGINAAETLAALDIASGVEVFVFDKNSALVASTVGLSRQPAPMPEGGLTVITDILNFLWDGMSALMHQGNRSTGDPDPAILARSMVATAASGQSASQTTIDRDGNTIFTVSTPISRGDQVFGAVVLTSVAGEIDVLIRSEREQVLRIFVLASLVSIGLSLLLANTFANPLADLAAAAEIGRDKNARKISPNRVRIPDLTARPDEIGRLSGALRGMLAALYDRIDANEQFAADVAHEIKNPLASLRSAVGTLHVAKRDDQRQKLLEVIEHDVRRLDRLVSDISNASRLDSELVKEEEESFNLLKLLENLAEHLGADARKKGVDFISDLPDEPIIIHGLEARIAQVFVNLITNAVSFCEEGDAVRIWARTRENRVLVVFEDTGPGIPEQALNKIFNRFYSERPAGQFGDHSGLGLAISKQIVEAHGGVIWAENIRPTDADITSEPLGARFVVGLPV
ncbi:sensor N-terminal transmembrane domain-containing protein [Actibacterium sp.]|uniref:sensor N-terminal transmembrane domain-containing protein n=1 Tax=Actibacterium sp. TaxID=1872125 RepID=UPI0035625B13